MRNRKQKKKKENSPPSAWSFPAQATPPPFSRARFPLSSRGPSSLAAPAPAPDSPAPPVSCSSPLPLASLSHWQPGPARQIPRPTHVVTGAFITDHRPPRLLAINARTSLSYLPAHCARAIPSPLAPSPPSWRARRRLPSLLPFPLPGRL
jgi:hypothetical protein